MSEDVIVYGYGPADELWRIWWAKRAIDRAMDRFRERARETEPKRDPVLILERGEAPGDLEAFNSMLATMRHYEDQTRRAILGALMPTDGPQQGT